MSEAEHIDTEVTLDNEGVDAPPVETPPDPPIAAEKKVIEFTPEQQEHINDIVRKKTAQKGELERARDEERQRREAVEAELAKLKAPQRPEVPPMPEEFDDDREAKIAARDAALLAQAKYDAQKDFENQQKQAAERAEIERQQAEINTTVQSYVDTAEKLGIDRVTVANESALLADVILDQRLLSHVLKMEHGPLIGSYIVNNPLEAEKIAKSDGYEAAAYIESVIKPKAIESRKKVEPDTPPLDNPEGAGLGEPNDDDKWGTYS